MMYVPHALKHQGTLLFDPHPDRAHYADPVLCLFLFILSLSPSLSM